MSGSSAGPVNIFQGQRFWLSREVPQRSWLKDRITVCLSLLGEIGIKTDNYLETWRRDCLDGE
jgi:hypothetical protein